MNEIDEKLTEIVALVLLLEPEDVRDAIRRGELDSWDSMAHLVLISEVENSFGITFEDEEIVEIYTVSDLKASLKKKL